MRRDGTRLLVSAQLIDLRSGFATWSQTYDRDAADAMQLQVEIAAAVMASLQVRLLEGGYGTVFGRLYQQHGRDGPVPAWPEAHALSEVADHQSGE